jgi:hypothetical protein
MATLRAREMARGRCFIIRTTVAFCPIYGCASTDGTPATEITMTDKDVERVAFAWTPGHGAYKHYPPYVNITGNRIAVRGPELCNNGCYEPGPYAAIELSPEAFVELRAAIAKVDAECRNCLGEQWVCENHLDMAWPTICECGAGAPCPICRPDMANAACESAATDIAKLGTVSLTSFDGHCVRIEFPNREDAERMYAVLTAEGSR